MCSWHPGDRETAFWASRFHTRWVAAFLLRLSKLAGEVCVKLKVNNLAEVFLIDPGACAGLVSLVSGAPRERWGRGGWDRRGNSLNIYSTLRCDASDRRFRADVQ